MVKEGGEDRELDRDFNDPSDEVFQSYISVGDR